VLLESLTLEDFRNYEASEVAFSDGLNLVIGRNGQGKTNLLEAIYFVSRLSSWRPGPNSTLIRYDSDRAIIRSVFKATSADRKTRVDGEISPSSLRVLVNGVPLYQADRTSLPATVLFSPEDLVLIKGAPEGRRRYLDHLAGSLRPMASGQRLEFERVLKQRNGLLKAAQHNPRALKSLDAWDEQFVKAGAALIADRLSALEAISQLAPSHHKEVSGESAELAVRYAASWSAAPGPETIVEDLREAVEGSRPADRDRGMTQVGPQRDDLEVSLGGQDSRVYASQGQQRTISLALRLAERGAIKEARGEDPVLLLDDVFSELDDERRERMTELVSSSGQSIATATSATGIPLRANKVLSVGAGKVIVERM
jgi:DNA replication and repair protein RecF